MLKILIFLLLLSCGTKSQYPAWFTNVSQNNTKIYGIGSGITIEEAKKVALSDIASQIRVSVSSSTISTMRDDSRIGYERGLIQDISNKVEDTIIPSYNVLKSENLQDGRFIVLISVEKIVLIDQYNTELSTINSQITNSYNNYLDSQDILKKRLYLEHTIVLSRKAIILSSILSSLSTKVNIQNYINNMERYQEQLDKNTRQINFTIEGDDKDIKEIIQKNLNFQGFNVQFGHKNENTLIVGFSSKEFHNTIFDENIIKLTIVIQLKNNNNNITRTNVIEINGSSIINKEDAKRVAIKNLDQKFSSEGILSFLGLNN